MRRGKALRPGKPLRSGRSTLRRGKALAQVSAKRAARVREEGRDAVRAEVFRRDGWECQVRRLCPNADDCRGPLTFHHVVKEGQGGAYTVENGATACAYHNVRLEQDAGLRREALVAGLVRERWRA